MHKKILAYTMAIAIIVSGITFAPSPKKASAAVADPSDSGWQLQWSDEFNGNSLDGSVWTCEQGAGGWGNNELQYYTNRTDNVFVSDGNLNIRAKRENYNGSNYTSGRLITKNKKYFKYGKMEARIKVDGGNQNGVWPAFWMMGNDYDQVGWPKCGELDIMEHANDRNYVEGTLHWGPSWDAHSSWGSFSDGNYKYYSDNTNNGINGWHTYGVTWDSNNIKWYMDNEVYLVASIGDGYDSQSYFNKDAFFLLNLALGSQGTGYTGYKAPDANFQSATMMVDYVRAYSYGGSGGDVTQPTTTAKPTTAAPSGGLVANTDVPVDTWGQFGNYYVYTGTWDGNNTAKAGVDSSNPNHIVVQKTNTVYNSAWLTQVKMELPALQGGTDYTYEWPIKATNSDGTVCSSDGTNGDNNQTPLTGSNQTLTGKVEVSNGTTCIVVGMGWVNPSNPIEFFQPTVKDKNGNVVYPAQQPTTTTQKPTTTKPTTTAPTTKAPTTAPTTKAPTTVPTTKAPTNKPTTKAPTVAPTNGNNPTANPSKIIKPSESSSEIVSVGSTKVKKAKKKKSAKKIKVKLKKTSGATYYQVRAFKSKKDAKKNRKALTTKEVRKVKFTFKSKKFKNRKKIYLRARVFVVRKGIPYPGLWSKPKKVKIKK